MTREGQHRTHCRICRGREFVRALSLRSTPPADAFVTADRVDRPQPRYPLDLMSCQSCGHVQLGEAVDPFQLFHRNLDAVGLSPTAAKPLSDHAVELLERYRPPADGLVVDIGSNDGTFLKVFEDAGRRVQGVEPAVDVAGEAIARGIPTFPGFFAPPIAERIEEERGPAAIVRASRMLAHADDLAGVLEGVRRVLARDGVFAFEVCYLADIVERSLFDTITHANVHYHAVAPLRRLLEAHGLEMIAVERASVHRGSLRGVAQSAGGPRAADGSVARLVAEERRLGLGDAATLSALSVRIDALGRELTAALTALRAEGKRIAGFGAPANATTLMHHFGIGPEVVEFIVDDSPRKQGLYTPGLHIPVLPAEALYERRPDCVLVLAWNHVDAILARHDRFRAMGGRFIVPLPEVAFV